MKTGETKKLSHRDAVERVRAAATLLSRTDRLHDDACPHSLCDGDCEDTPDSCQEPEADPCTCSRAQIAVLSEAGLKIAAEAERSRPAVELLGAHERSVTTFPGETPTLSAPIDYQHDAAHGLGSDAWGLERNGLYVVLGYVNRDGLKGIVRGAPIPLSERPRVGRDAGAVFFLLSDEFDAEGAAVWYACRWAAKEAPC